MNNNRNQNNRRRGRGNRSQGGGGGGNQSNRIDSRARGNAPQLLEKYRKLAEDAHRNGDRVQAEYYLQFADHYFRVIADNRARMDDQRGPDRQDMRGPRRDERDMDEFDGEFDEEREERQRFEPREARRDRPRQRPMIEGGEEGVRSEANEGPAFEPEDNPFTRDLRAPGEPREDAPRRRAPRPRREANGSGHGNGTVRPEMAEPAGFDPSLLPPSFSASETYAESETATDSDGESGEPAPRRRRKRGEGGTLSAVG
ncbi:DUF4167 domain-containing protein [Qipengyuania sediminis]|uniref:DUF4167 domain-containing protein n=1 Tax=Qipengyuania sediminis TaxID=1532023 RepID=UPI00105929B7|nr:DUF4167 domain-containing protein [Qipengyuania sediminis]